MRSWVELWHHFTAVLAHAPVAAVLTVWVGLALVLVMALEGLLLNLFPACVFHRYLEKMPERKKRSSAPPQPVAAPMPKPVVIAAPPPAPVIPAPEPEPVIVAPAPAVATQPPADGPAAPPAKSRPRTTRNPKKPAPGPKPRPAISARRVPPRQDRLSRGTSRLLGPKN
jgi:hypothetical protein